MKQKLIVPVLFFSFIYAFSAEYYVDASRPDDSGNGTTWSTAKQTIQAAVDLTVDGDTVWVTNGVYDVGGSVAPPYVDPEDGSLVTNSLMNRVCITNAIALKSVNGADVTVIRGASDNGGLGPAAIRCVYMNPWSLLDGFTLTGGYTSSTQGRWIDVDGGGALLFEGATLNSCRLIENNAVVGGGACVYSGWLNNCLIINNKARGVGGVHLSAGTLNSSTIAGNFAEESVGGIAVGNGGFSYTNSVVNNCIIFGNSAGFEYSNIYVDSPSSIIQFTCSDPASPGEGNINVDPLFVNSTSSNFHLQAASPCINAGINSYAPVGVDLSGNPRIINGTVDMGAYEFYVGTNDFDADGLPNEWEVEYFGTITKASTNTTCANSINTILQAYIAGLDPNDPLSRFELAVDQGTYFGNIVRWQPVAGREYAVYYSTNLLNGFEPLVEHLVSGTGTYIHEFYGDEATYYKIDVQIDEDPSDNVIPESPQI